MKKPPTTKILNGSPDHNILNSETQLYCGQSCHGGYLRGEGTAQVNLSQDTGAIQHTDCRLELEGSHIQCNVRPLPLLC